VAFARDGEDPLNEGRVSGLLKCKVVEEGANGRQTDIAARGTDAALLKVLQESADKRRVKVL
jgi:hypothetical protein